MHGAAVSLAQSFLDSGFKPDLLLATDMLDLGQFLALTRRQTARIPAAVYFHENQLTYPWSPSDADVALQRDNHYAYINYSSALAADACFFNSAYHRDSFLAALPAFLKAFPDKRGLHRVQEIAQKASVLDLGMDLGSLRSSAAPLEKPPAQAPVLLWNHRWEYDKGPEEFFKALIRLREEGIGFRLRVLGEGYGRVPEIFAAAREALADRLLHWGFAEDKAAYAAQLASSDILPVTSRQDFFGGSAVEAMALGCVPLLPRRLNYPALVPEAFHGACLYGEGDFENALREMILGGAWRDIRPQPWTERFDWRRLAPLYDAAFEGAGRAFDSRLS